MTTANTNAPLRIRLLSLGVILIALICVVRLFFVQVIHSEEYKEETDRRYVSASEGVFDRGIIYFQKKDGTHIAAASIVSGYKLTVNPSRIKDRAAAYALIAGIVPVEQELFMSRTVDTTDTYADFPDRLTEEQAAVISELKIAGVQVIRQKWRFYPGGELGAHILGLVGFKGNDLAGRYGIERSYNETLARRAETLYINPFAEVFTNIARSLFVNTVREGDVITTIEPTVEQYLDSSLASINEKYHPDQLGAIVMDPQTGAILAMSVYPPFDPNDFSTIKNAKQFGNPFVEHVYEFGSVIKPLVMALALDAGVVTPETTYTDRGFVVVKDKTINNFDKKGRGLATMQTALDQSLNTGMVFAQQRLGKEKFRDGMLRYGIGEKTGVDLPSETTGLISNLKTNGDVEYANAAFGQGIALTPIAAVRAFATLANGGYLVTPHVVESIEYPDGADKTPERIKSETSVFSNPETAATIQNMMVHVADVMNNGTRKIEHYSIAAKTGTGQVAREDGKGYYDDRNMHSLFGFYPASNPRFVVFFFAENPKGSPFAATTLADPFFATAKFLLSYYDVPPDR